MAFIIAVRMLVHGSGIFQITNLIGVQVLGENAGMAWCVFDRLYLAWGTSLLTIHPVMQNLHCDKRCKCHTVATETSIQHYVIQNILKIIHFA